MIRKPRPEDAAELAAMVDELSVHEGDEPGRFTPAKALADAIAPGAPLSAAVAEEDGVLVGYVFWHFGYESAWAARGSFVADLYVRASHRGGGIGDALLRAAAKATAAAGGTFLWWTAYRSNERARGFYRKRAFEEDRVVAYAAAHEKFEALLDSDRGAGPFQDADATE
ncbi:MAG: GNAT family N-acetyltransferase [Pseudomonadota bacterium]